MKLAYRIALRFLSASKAQTILILFGIAVGVAVQVFLGALIQGLQVSLVDTTIGSSSQITITSREDSKTLSKPQVLISALRSSGANIKNISSAVDASGFIQYKEESEPVLLRGFELNEADSIYKIEQNMYEGTLPEKEYEVLIGKELSEKINAKVGDALYILTSTGNAERVKISGKFDLKLSQINKTWLITKTKTVQNIFGLENKVTSIEMQLDKVFTARETSSYLVRNLSNPDLLVENWMDQNEQLLSGLNGQSVSSYMIQFFVLIAVTLGIASVLAVSVVQKSKQIGILKAIGMNPIKASMIFVFQGFILGVLGAVLGISMGFGLLKMFTTFAKNPDGTPVIPILINWRFIGISAIVAMFAAIVASLIPARLSSRLSPIEVIRNG
jgi:lipoprotein-releasing system permease protein